MSLESASYISGLNTSNPPVGDPVGNAADHLRLIKSVVKNTFPNITGPVTTTDVQLSGSLVPVGGIIFFAGTTAPAGWGLCNGTTYAKLDGSGNIVSPNLVDRFIVGSGNLYALGNTGGSTTNVHALTTYGTALTLAQLPNIPVTISDPTHGHGVYDPPHTHGIDVFSDFVSGTSGAIAGKLRSGGSTAGATTGISIYGASTGITAYVAGTGGQSHAHTGSTDTQTNLPPYYALAYILKL